ncbi:MAG TPA: HNH endonuclease signature motif containing protein [Actinomycetota bacterium]|nr:HNH endonuclease signature motif containing protein [Actinomycetota bacterium]
MSTGYIRADLRRLVAARADYLCEYCLIHEEDSFFGCEVDHVISEKHGGLTREDNLAYACLVCNRKKGSDVASIVPETGELVRLFNPRTDRWSDHFGLSPLGPHGIIMILASTPIGKVTSQLLGLNDSPRLLEREALRQIGRYPTPAAQARLGK